MVLTRAAPEKWNKEELISLFVENDDNMDRNMDDLTNQLVEVKKTLEKIEFQLQILDITNNTIEIRIANLEK